MGAVDQYHPIAVQSGDDGHLPQRPPHVQRSRQDSHHQLSQCGAVSRGRQHLAAHVSTEVKVRVVHPHRVRDVQRHPLDALAVSRHEVDPFFNRLLDPERAASARHL